MSKTLNLVDTLLESGRHLRDVGRITEAIDVLNRLADFRQLRSSVVEETQALLAELHLRSENYSKARRHLTAALAFRPLEAEYHHMMATAIEEDVNTDLKRAEMYYAEAVKLEADNPGYWVDYGTYLLRVGKRSLGLKALRKAFSWGSHDADIVGQVAEALRSEGRGEEAAKLLRDALFLNRNGQRFQELWLEHQFQQIREQQQARWTEAKKGPMILPFAPVEQTGKYVELGEKTIRIDQAEPVRGPKSPVPMPFRRRNGL